ncbi:siderophore-interacting protein [Dactylosporangium sp. CA-139066]|uniref:siderophore-interacting protein n=1 Tax=Dactylosporangium sp. CA-139066 TaxID=3239930 RepID=UPI003D93F742
MTFDFFDVQVVRHRALTPAAVRVTFAGPDLDRFAGGGRDQRFKLFFPRPGQAAPLVPRGEDWFGRWRAMDPATRGVMRTYTVGAQRDGEFDVDFALHPGGGPAIRWASGVSVGDRLVALGPTEPDNGGVDFRPPPDTEWVLLAGDDTAVPALAAIHAWLDPALPVHTWVAAEPGRCRPGAVRCDGDLVSPVRAATLPAGTPYAWIAGESGQIRALRRHLVQERGFDRHRVTFTGYWRRGATEDDLIAEAA